ncbi:hypothetical protein CEXT_697361 [Caerostris extrusa]|uniref:Uncharacterized protein n=1 Tax=Caerostris extrusa TaxID=172846 RepID=A0AAV4MI45_CAEEX|nr:hypothetical protein CEXT_697361 [Caerostris extrusa]
MLASHFTIGAGRMLCQNACSNLDNLNQSGNWLDAYSGSESELDSGSSRAVTKTALTAWGSLQLMETNVLLKLLREG